MGRSKLKIGLTQQGSDEGGSTGRTSKQIEDYHRRKRTFQYKKNDRGKIIKIPMLTGGQAKLDKNKNKKIDAEDFALLRKEKSKGKPMKAFLGALAVGALGAMGAKKFFKKKKATATPGMGPIRGSGTGLGGMAAGLVSKKMKELGLDKTSLMGGGMMKRYNTGGGADMGIQKDKDKISERTRTYALAQSMKNKDRLTERDIKKAKSLVKGKMGGGMAMKVPGYNKGKSVMARGCKLGRKKPTKMY